MTTLRSADMETYVPSGLSEAGSTSLIGQSSVWSKSGTNSCLVDTTGGAAQAWLAGSLPASTRMVVGRVHGRRAANTSGTMSWIQFTTATGGNIYFRWLTTGAMRLTMASTNTAGPTIALDTDYLLEFRLNTSANPWLVDWCVDGTDRTQGTLAVAAADITADNYGCITTVTFKNYIDDILLTDQSGDYKLGAYVAPTTSYDPLGMMGIIGMNEHGIHVPQQAKTPSGIYLA
jgi:hypothetical protein